jgi:hypothetical protein
MTTITSRRAILAGAASLPALAVPALAVSGISNSDPVFAFKMLSNVKESLKAMAVQS